MFYLSYLELRTVTIYLILLIILILYSMFLSTNTILIIFDIFNMFLNIDSKFGLDFVKSVLLKKLN